MAEGEKSWVEKNYNTISNTISATTKEALRSKDWAKTPEEKLASKLIDELFSVINRVKGNTPQQILDSQNFKNLKPTVRENVQQLIDFGELEMSFERSPNRLQKIEESIKGGLKGGKMIMYFSNGKHEVKEKSKYINDVNRDISELNANVLQGILKNPSNQLKYKDLFGQTTWEDIATYITGKPDSRLIIGLDKSSCESFFKPYIDARRLEQDNAIGPLFTDIRNKFSDNKTVQNAIQKLGEKADIKYNKDGKPDWKGMEAEFLSKPENQGKNEKEVMKEFAKIMATIKEKLQKIEKNTKGERDILSKKIGNKNSITDFSEISGINTKVRGNDGKNIDIKNIPLDSINGEHARFILTEIAKKYPKNIPEKLIDIILLLGLQIKLQEARYNLGSSTEAERQTRKGEKINENKTHDAGKISAISGTLEDGKKYTGNKTDTELQDELKKLKANPNKTPESEKRIAILEYRAKEGNGVLARTYADIKKKYGEEANEIFRSSFETGRGYPLSPSEVIKYESLAKIATLTDPESTPGEKSLARLEAGQSIPMWKALEGEMQTSVLNAPELSQVNISKNSDGTYAIPIFGEKSLSEKQVDEYKESTKLYAELGLSQFIPHIPLINTELISQGLDARVDGQISTMKQQKILKSLYSKLFGKEIISSSLGEVERAYASALGNPTNMKSAMQHTLSVHKLIAGPGESIAPDRLQKWFRENNTMETLDPLKNLV